MYYVGRVVPGNGHFFVLTKSGAAAKMLGDVVSAYRMPIAGAHQPTFFPFGVQRKPYTNASHLSQKKL